MWPLAGETKMSGQHPDTPRLHESSLEEINALVTVFISLPERTELSLAMSLCLKWHRVGLFVRDDNRISDMGIKVQCQ